MHRFIRATTALALLAGTAGCAPKIASFQISPLVACQRQPITLDWRVSGTPQLQVRLDPGDRSAASEPPIDTMTFLLTVDRGGKQAVREVSTLVQPDSFQHEVVFPTGSIDTGDVVAQGQVGERWSGFTILQLASSSGRPVRVLHGGRDGSLPADGTPSTAFAGLPLTGDWTLRTPADAPRPDRLRVTALLTCKR